MAGPVLYPCLPPPQNTETLRNQHTNDNRVLWATLTPNGPQHYISSASYHSPQSTPATLTQQDDHYEVVDHQMRVQQHYTSNTTGRIPIVKSFENSGFTDYDYEDPVRYAESFRTDDMDSGYQEPQDILVGSLPRSRSPRHHNTISITSSPIHHPNSQQQLLHYHHLPSIITNPINSSPIRNYPPPYHQQSPQHQQLLLHQQHSLHHPPHYQQHHHHPQQQQHQHHQHRNVTISTLNRKSNLSRKTNCDDGSSSGRYNI